MRRASLMPAVLRYVRTLDAVIERRECGANAKGGGGFQAGNTCGKGDGGGGADAGDTPSGGARYREAKTKEEAESVAKSYAKKVSYRGVDVASANRINSQIDEFFANHPDMPPLESIEAKKFTGTSATGSDTAPAAYHMLANRLMINTAIMGSKKKWDEYVSKASEAKASVRKALDEGRLQGRQKEVAEMHLQRGSLVDDSFEGAIVHEMGHHFDATVLMKSPSAERKALMDRRAQYESKLSAYASTNAFEYFAESYVAYRRGREIDPELKAIFDKRSGKK